MEKIKMVEFLGEMVPAELCTIDREGGADDFVGCGGCYEDPSTAECGCENCVVNRIFREYARLTGQMPPAEKTEDSEGQEPEVEDFIVNYNNGTQKIIEKGFFCEIQEEAEETALSFIMAHCGGRDLETIVLGCVQLGVKLGMI